MSDAPNFTLRRCVGCGGWEYGEAGDGHSLAVPDDHDDPVEIQCGPLGDAADEYVHRAEQAERELARAAGLLACALGSGPDCDCETPAHTCGWPEWARQASDFINRVLDAKEVKE